MNYSIGQNIKSYRKQLGLTQEELASQLFVTAQAVSKWKSDAGMPDTAQIVPLAKALNISTDALFGLDNGSYDEADALWKKHRYEAVRKSIQVIRYCKEPKIVEMTHYAIAWVYYLENNFDESAAALAELKKIIGEYVVHCSEELEKENLSELYDEKGIGNMKKYTPEGGQRRLDELLGKLKAWNGEDSKLYKDFCVKAGL